MVFVHRRVPRRGVALTVRGQKPEEKRDGFPNGEKAPKSTHPRTNQIIVYPDLSCGGINRNAENVDFSPTELQSAHFVPTKGQFDKSSFNVTFVFNILLLSFSSSSHLSFWCFPYCFLVLV